MLVLSTLIYNMNGNIDSLNTDTSATNVDEMEFGMGSAKDSNSNDKGSSSKEEEKGSRNDEEKESEGKKE